MSQLLKQFRYNLSAFFVKKHRISVIRAISNGMPHCICVFLNDASHQNIVGKIFFSKIQVGKYKLFQIGHIVHIVLLFTIYTMRN